jgi:hypothetical protein
MAVRDVKIHTTARLPVGLLLEIEELTDELEISRNAVMEVILRRGMASYRKDYPRE